MFCFIMVVVTLFVVLTFCVVAVLFPNTYLTFWVCSGLVVFGSNISVLAFPPRLCSVVPLGLLTLLGVLESRHTRCSNFGSCAGSSELCDISLLSSLYARVANQFRRSPASNLGGFGPLALVALFLLRAHYSFSYKRCACLSGGMGILSRSILL